MPVIDRRSFVLGSANLAGTLLAAGLAAVPERATLAGPVTRLTIGRRTIDVNGRAASVFGILQDDGTPGLNLNPDQHFHIELLNRIGEDTIVHWHGQTPPYLQDGVADRNVPLIAGASRQLYEYRPRPGTHWMHSHHSLQEQGLLAAPLVVRSAEDIAADVQEITVLLHDFTFRDPQEILAELKRTGSGMESMDHGGMEHGGMDHSGMDHSGMDTPQAMDLNDVAYDAFLANDRTLSDPLLVRVERRGRVRLRLINAAASSNFWIDLGGLEGRLMAVDGNPVEPVTGRRFPMASAQRLDLMIDVAKGGAFPILAQVEGLLQRTGLIIATPGARVEKIADVADAPATPVDLSLESLLRARAPLPSRAADVELNLRLTGSMSPYVWSINAAVWPDAERPVVREGQRVVVELYNPSMMAHPMHLHGHHFQVVALDGSRMSGAVRDTVLVPSGARVHIAFDADNPGRWPFHCHNLYHMIAGMMTEFVYDGFA